MIGDTRSNGASYFGKVPARGDFIKGGGPSQMIAMLDRWISESMDLLSGDPRWRIVYDNMPEIHFAFVGPRSRFSIVGHLQPSQDASSRRFPFLVAAAIERDDRVLFDYGPAAFSRLWGKFERIVRDARSGDDPTSILGELSSIDCEEEISRALALTPPVERGRRLTIKDLDELLSSRDKPTSSRRIMLALGLLLRPLLGASNLPIEKGLQLPLPADREYRDAVSAIWVSLISGFFKHTHNELQVLQGLAGGRDALIVGFNGASARTLLSLISPNSDSDTIIPLDDPDWIDTHPDLVNDYGVAKLSSYLSHPDNTLDEALASFRDVFLGE
ncbi:type VI secretion system-associated protein TagF [Aromatoleum diolicum]|uniref:Type VI secretion system-associated protein TagF n=1 Tax=Aromatoleum diolicum TaxID=75796 RepID=A0ABX1QH64_9RHOO|nr:type VI secretion system-associated protein TagF [Aromatoleum diolicum]NMG76331.1 type VI secretion system-associated protein TagF [Aromatoleum diolicum]